MFEATFNSVSSFGRSLARVNPIYWVFGLCGALAYLQLPAGVTAMNDDFGYLRSVIETIQRGRPWTDQWLEPWSASLAALSAAIFLSTGSFQLGIFGIQTLGAAATGAGIYALLRAKNQSPSVAAMVTILAVTFPTISWKMVEYTSLVVYMPCLIWAVWSAYRLRWMLFFFIWCVALGSRQSAIAWLVPPLWAVATSAIRPGRTWSSLFVPGSVAVGGIIVFAVLHFLMNKTQAQLMITDQLFESVQSVHLTHHLIYGIGVWSVCAGIGALFCRSDIVESSGQSPFARNVTVLVFGMIIFSLLEILPRVYAEHYAFEGMKGILYRNFIVTVGLIGWMRPRFRIRWDFLFASICALALVCLRRDVWDYYYVDIGVFGAFGITSTANGPRVRLLSGSPRIGVLSLVALLAYFHGRFAFEQKCRVDREYAACVVTEMALRAGTLKADEIGHTPYGFMGWHLHRYFVLHDGKGDADIGGFIRYQRKNAAEVRLSPMRFWSDSHSLREIDGADETRVIASGLFSVGWIFNQRYSLLRNDGGEIEIGSPAIKIDQVAYTAHPFPINDAEWASYVRKENKF